MENQLKYVGGKEASKILGVHQRTLYQWDEKGWIDVIRTDSNKRLYNVYKYMCNIIYERYLLAKVYFTKFNDCRALKLNNLYLPKDTFHKLYYTYEIYFLLIFY